MVIIRTLIAFLLIVLISAASGFLVYRAKHPPKILLFENSDFERGSLKNWTAEGAAFISQPTLGDNPLKRGLHQPTKFQGNYWVGTYENHPVAESPEGTFQGDSKVGKLTSSPFTLKKNKILFLAGAGIGTPVTSIALFVNGEPVLTHSPNASLTASEELAPVSWDVTPWKNQTATIVITDFSLGDRGHINADDFHYE